MTYFSWGIHKLGINITDKKEAALVFRVQGYIYKGWMRIIYNEGMDTFTIQQVLKSKDNVFTATKEIEGAYCDDLSIIVDRWVEKAGSDEQYEKLANTKGLFGTAKEKIKLELREN